MRRLSSFKTTPKLLLNSINVENEFCGYENEAVFFPNDVDGSFNPDVLNDVVVCGRTSTSSSPDSSPHMVEKVQKRDSVFENGVKDEKSDDSAVESPSPKRKGIRRFFCMPSKSSRWSQHKKSFKKKKMEKNYLLDGDE